MAELREACLGGGAGGVHGDDAATAAARGAAQDVDGEGVLVKRGPVEATGGTTLLRLSAFGFGFGFGDGTGAGGGGAVTTGLSAA